MEVPAEVLAFKESAERFCAWAETPVREPGEDLHNAMAHLAELYLLALRMPGADSDASVEDLFVDKNNHEDVYRRFAHLPLQYYGEVFDTTVVPPEEPTVGDLADDLLDIYADVKGGLAYFVTGHPVQAVFHWKFTWGIHWGRHATSALRAMHCFRSKV
jgi:Domain of unknown function (DUF5063)